MNINEFERELKKIDKEFYIILKTEGSVIYQIKKFDEPGYIIEFDVADNWYMTYFDGIKVDCTALFYQVLELFAKFMQTPPEERVEIKKYYLRHRWMEEVEGNNYLNYGNNGRYFISNNAELEGYQTKFAQKEIEEIKEKLNTDLSDFAQIEVEE